METEHNEKYRGHAIKVDVTQVRTNAWTWAYGIDSKVFSNSSRPLPDAEAALKRGILAARARVDEIEG